MPPEAEPTTRGEPHEATPRNVAADRLHYDALFEAMGGCPNRACRYKIETGALRTSMNLSRRQIFGMGAGLLADGPVFAVETEDRAGRRRNR